MELFTPDFGLVFWMFVAFGILFVILWKKAWPAIMKTVDERADLIDKGVEYAQNAKEQLDDARRQAQEVVAAAQRQQTDILRQADAMKTQIIDQARDAAKVEAQKVMDDAAASIEESKKQAMQSFRDEVSTVALDIAQKVVRNQLEDAKAQTKLVNTLLDQIENKN